MTNLDSILGEVSGIPLQYSCLENPMDGGAWWAAVHGVWKRRTRLSDFTFTFHHKGGVICISEVIDISPGNLDSSLCFFQPSISVYKLNKQGANIQP